MPERPTAPTAGEQRPDADVRNGLPQDRAVLRAVLAALGRPPDLFRAVVRPLWENHFRVNVLTGADVTSAWIAHSYFVEAGAAGDILAATPRITRRYA
jgi:hypothetical protein